MQNSGTVLWLSELSSTCVTRVALGQYAAVSGLGDRFWTPPLLALSPGRNRSSPKSSGKLTMEQRKAFRGRQEKMEGVEGAVGFRTDSAAAGKEMQQRCGRKRKASNHELVTDRPYIATAQTVLPVMAQQARLHSAHPCYHSSHKRQTAPADECSTSQRWYFHTCDHAPLLAFTVQ